MKKWNWKVFGLSAAIAVAFVLQLSVLFSWVHDSVVTFIAVAVSVVWSLWMYCKNADGMNDYAEASFLLGNWAGAFVAALSFIAMML
jgi:hypothetical protein